MLPQICSAGRALSLLISKLIKNKGFPYNVFTTLYEACVRSICHYGSEVFGFEEFNSQMKLHLRAARAYLGLPKNVTSSGLLSELDWLLLGYVSQIKMIHFYGRLLETPSNRLLYRT